MKAVRMMALITLGFLGVTSLIGGIPLILAPSGRLLHMPLSLLAHSPFHNFLIPGILLTASCGLLCVWIFVEALRRSHGYGNLVVLQGFVIAEWITAEVVLIQAVVWAHYVYWAVGLILIVCGLVLRRDCGVAKPVLVLPGAIKARS